MNGAQHYRRAEELLADITDTDGTVDFGDGGEAFVAAAQVHATLALAAATALSAPDYALPVLDGNKWFDVAGTKAAGDCLPDQAPR